jgi:hypothetical protein
MSECGWGGGVEAFGVRMYLPKVVKLINVSISENSD